MFTSMDQNSGSINHRPFLHTALFQKVLSDHELYHSTSKPIGDEEVKLWSPQQSLSHNDTPVT